MASLRCRPLPLLPPLPPPCRSMEGAEFVTDEDNLAAWHRRFRQHHCWAVDVGPATFIGLSTTRFRRWGWTWAGAMPGGSPPNMPTPGSITVQRCVRRTTHSLCKAVPPDPHPSLPPRVPACCRCPTHPPTEPSAVTLSAPTRCTSTTSSWPSSGARSRRRGGAPWSCSRTRPSWAAASRWCRRCTSRTGAGPGGRGPRTDVRFCCAGVKNSWRGCGLMLLPPAAASPAPCYAVPCVLPQVRLAEPQQQPTRLHRARAAVPKHPPVVQVRRRLPAGQPLESFMCLGGERATWAAFSSQ